MKLTNSQTTKRDRIKRRIRAKISGTADCPRLSVYKSNQNIYAQVINDVTGATLCAASDVKDKSGTKRDRAIAVGRLVGEAAKKLNITQVVFDRNGFNYSGRIKLLADSAREAGLKF